MNVGVLHRVGSEVLSVLPLITYKQTHFSEREQMSEDSPPNTKVHVYMQLVVDSMFAHHTHFHAHMVMFEYTIKWRQWR